jgi:translocator protein
MTEKTTGVDRFRAILVLAATIGTIAFNWLAATGRIGGVTPAVIFDKYPTLVTPAGFAFTIWFLIYAGLIAFSIYQLLPQNAVRYRGIRSYYVLSCALNCGLIYMWLHDQMAVSLVLISLLAASLFLINLHVRETNGPGEYWLAKAPFGIYFGWVTAAMLVNFAVLLVYWNVRLSENAGTTVAVVLILFAALLGVLIRIRLVNYLYPLAIAWALTGIGVKQSGHTLVTAASAVGVVACLIATLSFVVTLPSSDTPRE